MNYTSSDEVLASCAAQCGLDEVITSKEFLDKIPNLHVPGRALLLEEALRKPSLTEKMRALALSCLVPAAWMRRALGASRRAVSMDLESGVAQSPVDQLATVIFSSGSTGDPKGVMLTHFNVMSNIGQVSQVFMLGAGDKILGILPFFHSFGFMAALWLPAVNGVGVVYHPNPLDAGAIGALVAKYKVTFMVATPTFLQTYMRRCSPDSFASLEYVLVGAEKLQERVALAFEDTFGIRPLEGYGCTECSPVVAVNGRDYRAPGFLQIAARRGRIGHPLPGVCVKVLDIETGAPGCAGNRRNADGEGTERDARQIYRQTGEDRGGAKGRLVHDRRRRGHGRRRVPHHHRPAFPIQQDRRRDGAPYSHRRKAAGDSRGQRPGLRGYLASR